MTMFYRFTICVGLFLTVAIMFGKDGPENVTIVFSHRTLTFTNQNSITIDAVALLRTSNYNSKHHSSTNGSGPFSSGMHGVQARYRNAVAGNYVLIAFAEPRHFNLIRGTADVVEIVIGINQTSPNPEPGSAVELDRTTPADTLFTIDPEGHVVEHSMFSGSDAVKFKDTVRSILINADKRVHP